MRRVFLHVRAEPGFGFARRTTGFVAVVQRIELDIRQRTLVHDFCEQRNRPVEVELLAGQTPRALAGLRVFLQLEQANPVTQRRRGIATPFTEVSHLLEQIRIFRIVDRQLLTRFPGTGQITDGQAHVEIFQRDFRVVRLQGLPLFQHALRQIKALARHRDINALLEPLGIGLCVGQLRQFVRQHLRCLIATTGRQQTVERQLRILATLAVQLSVPFELQINLGCTAWLLAGHVPLGSGFERLAA